MSSGMVAKHVPPPAASKQSQPSIADLVDNLHHIAGNLEFTVKELQEFFSKFNAKGNVDAAACGAPQTPTLQFDLASGLDRLDRVHSDLLEIVSLLTDISGNRQLG